MASRSNKRSRGEECDAKYRKGVYSKVDSKGTKSWCVEMRITKTKLKMHFGKYKTRDEAMIARDYAGFLRDSTGEEDRIKVSGYEDSNKPIYEFKESPGIFAKVDGSEARCVEFKCVFESNKQDACNVFVAKAKKDIAAAIQLFRSTDPLKFGNPRPVHPLPMADPVHGEAQPTQSPGLKTRVLTERVLTTAGLNVGDGSTVPGVKLLTTSEGLDPETLLLTGILGHFVEETRSRGLSVEESRSVALSWIGCLPPLLTDILHKKQLSDEMLAKLPPCPFDPNEFPNLDGDMMEPVWE